MELDEFTDVRQHLPSLNLKVPKKRKDVHLRGATQGKLS